MRLSFDIITLTNRKKLNLLVINFTFSASLSTIKFEKKFFDFFHCIKSSFLFDFESDFSIYKDLETWLDSNSIAIAFDLL